VAHAAIEYFDLYIELSQRTARNCKRRHGRRASHNALISSAAECGAAICYAQRGPAGNGYASDGGGGTLIHSRNVSPLGKAHLPAIGGPRIASLAEATAGQPAQGHLLSQISTRLFFSRPSAVSFDATGS
jgi:hypothetical protein